MSKNDTSISSDSRKEMPSRGKAKKTLMLQAIRDQVEGGEAEFLKRVVEISIGRKGVPETEGEPEVTESPPHPKLLALVLGRIEPPLKAVMPMVEFEFNIDAKPHEQAAQVVEAVSNGEISPDIGHMFISSIKSMIEIHEFTDLKNRIEKIEEMLGKD